VTTTTNMEIHITVPPSYLKRLTEFVGTKFPPVLTPRPFQVRVHHFVNHAKPPVEDVITSEPCSGTLDRALVVADARSSQLMRADIPVLRTKIEAEPFDHRVVTEPQYYETHFEFVGFDPLRPPRTPSLLISTAVRSGKVHGTVRSRNCTYEIHLSRVHANARALTGAKCQIVSALRHEVVLHDSSPGHDETWERSFAKQEA
jgi:hypothetical protein